MSELFFLHSSGTFSPGPSRAAAASRNATASSDAASEASTAAAASAQPSSGGTPRCSEEDIERLVHAADSAALQLSQLTKRNELAAARVAELEGALAGAGAGSGTVAIGTASVAGVNSLV